MTYYMFILSLQRDAKAGRVKSRTYLPLSQLTNANTTFQHSCVQALTLDRPQECDCHPSQPDKSRNDTICDKLSTMLTSKLQAKPTVDERESDERTANPHVNVPDNGTSLVLAESEVLQKAAGSY